MAVDYQSPIRFLNEEQIMEHLDVAAAFPFGEQKKAFCESIARAMGPSILIQISDKHWVIGNGRGQRINIQRKI
jgi:hypothetical protein